MYPKIGLSFAQGLRVVLRHDPDVLMVGKIRDPEPAEVIADYVDADDAPRPHGLEAQEEPPYRARNAPPAAPEEWRDLPGLSTEDVALLQRETTPYLDAEDRVNINTADERLLQALCAAMGAPALAAQIAAYRWDPEDGTAAASGGRFSELVPRITTVGAPLNAGTKDALARLMAGPLGDLLGVRSAHFTITAAAQTEHPAVRYRMEAVVRRAADASWQVLAWRAD